MVVDTLVGWDFGTLQAPRHVHDRNLKTRHKSVVQDSLHYRIFWGESCLSADDMKDDTFL